MMKPECSCSRPPMRPPRPQPEPPCCCDCCQCQNRPKSSCCSCSCCTSECRHPGAAAGFLLPRIMASGRTWQRRLAATLTVTGLPACAEPPFTLQWVSAACEAPVWEPLPCDHPRQLRLCATIPLLCQIRDCRGCCYYGQSSIQTEVCLSLTCPRAGMLAARLDASALRPASSAFPAPPASPASTCSWSFSSRPTSSAGQPCAVGSAAAARLPRPATPTLSHASSSFCVQCSDNI